MVQLSKVTVSAKHAWETFLFAAQALLDTEKRLTPREVEVMAFVLSRRPGTNCFRGMPRRALHSTLGISMHSASMYRKALNEKGWLDGDKPSAMILRLQQEFAKSDEIAFTINIRVDGNSGNKQAVG